MLLDQLQIYLLKFGIGRRNILLIGADNVTSFVANEIRKNPSLGMRVAGVASDDERSGEALKYLGNLSELSKIISEKQIDQVIASESKLSQTKIAQIIETCSDRSIALSFVPSIFGAMTISVKNDTIGSMPLLDVQTIALDGWGRIIKRICDIIFSALLLIVLSPILLIIVLLEKLTSRGPIFYSHDRIGRDGKKFKVYKFRSMYIDKCDFKDGGAKWTTAEDEKNRITPLGKIIRKTNIDELPQFWNILIGNMSFVGPRPEQPTFVEKFEREIPEYYKRHRVKSGLTGWAQVNGLKGDTSIPERVRYDMFYIENWSLWFDMKIVIKTIGLIIYEIFGGKYEYHTRP
jgi:exopolysaccharide biosynthesis polyprenyl glycosylphosphotransferase